MPLSEAEIAWINWVAGKGISQQDQDAQHKRSKARDSFLTDVLGGQLTAVSGDIDKAQEKIVARREIQPHGMKAVYAKLFGPGAKQFSEIKWRATDEDTNRGILDQYELRADVEIDTRADIDTSIEAIPADQLRELYRSFELIQQMERSMRMQLDDDGAPLFTDEDIRNELWTPLVRKGLIPDNMVPDRYSEHAVNFAGAKSFYEDKIEAYTATHTRTQERWTKGLQIAKDVAMLGGALTSGAVTIANAPDVAQNTKDINAKKLELEGLGANDPQRTELTREITELTKANTELAKTTTYVDAGTALLLGGISGVEIGVQHHYSTEPDTLKKWIQTIEKGVGVAQAVSIGAVTIGMTDQGAQKGMVTCVSAAMTAAFKGARLGPSLILAVKEQDPVKQASMITAMIGDFAGIVASSINAVGARTTVLTAEDKTLPSGELTQLKKDKAATEAAFKQIAAAIQVAITTTGSAPQIVRAYKAGDTRTLGLLLGGAAVSTTFAASSEAIFDGMRKDVTKTELLESSFHEAQHKEVSSETGHDTGSARIMEGLTGQLTAVNAEIFKGLKPDLLDGIKADEMAEALSDDVKTAQRQQAEEELSKAFSPEGIQAIMDEVDSELVGFEQIYSDARPDPDINSRTPQEILQATAAIDKAMANTSELRQKVAIINAVTGGAAGVIAALVPGAGAVVAAQKVAFDIYALIKCVQVHNAWVESMEIALAGQSGAAAGIQNTLKNARIHLSQASVKLVLDSLKVGAEVGRAFDPTGAATATSAGLTMAAAVVEFGFKMQKETDIIRGWATYKDALANPGNRKAARKALRMNSTLAKCSIAYGAAIMGDTTAKEAIRATGLTVAAFQNDKDICVKLIAYLENELSDDPTVLKVDYKDKGQWHPGTPRFTLASWTSFKAAAHTAAKPRLSGDSLSSPAIDRLFGALDKHPAWPRDDIATLVADAGKLRDYDADKMTPVDRQAFAPVADATRDRVGKQAMGLAEVKGYLGRLNDALQAYAPLAEGTRTAPHEGMAQIAATFATLARAERATVEARLTDLALP
ncbi:MAG: hypothetical protein CML66_20465 [Rhodobacteraceae bacterium]|nr:hypothetical protein [Paracoccaceae bacterium]MAY44445.1 hypothetical protein [Paracoccaceae bacterium]